MQPEPKFKISVSTNLHVFSCVLRKVQIRFEAVAKMGVKGRANFSTTCVVHIAQVMKRNIDRVSKIAEAGVESGRFIQSCFDWESKPRSITAFAVSVADLASHCAVKDLVERDPRQTSNLANLLILDPPCCDRSGFIAGCCCRQVFLIIVWNFELYMLPVTLLIIFLKNLLVVHIVGNLMKDKDEDVSYLCFLLVKGDPNSSSTYTRALKNNESKRCAPFLDRRFVVSLALQM